MACGSDSPDITRNSSTLSNEAESDIPSWTMGEMVGQVIAGSVCLIAHAKLRITEGKLAGSIADCLILLPQELECDTYPFKLLVDMSVVWLAVDGLVDMLVWIKLAICFLVR
jgi:hypothetical protein